MSRYVLLGARRFPQPEISPARLGADITRAGSYIRSLRCWQLFDCYATSTAEADQPRTVLVLRASSPTAAASLAAAWSSLSGFDVTVWPLVTHQMGDNL